MSKPIYLDFAAATPIDDKVLAVMRPYFQAKFHNPSATYLAAESVRKDLQKAREQIALILGAKPAEIIFTAGGTEANNLAVQGIMKKFPGKKLIVSAIEHESVLAPASRHKIKFAKVTGDGIVDVESLARLIDDETVLVSIMYANNEIGTIQPIRRVAEKIKEVRKTRQQNGNKLPIYLHTDAAQAGNYLDLHVSRLGVDLISINGGKIYGPKQSGVLYVASHVTLEPIIFGGGQERGYRSGTENVANCLGLAAALKIAQENREKESRRLSQLQEKFIKELNKIPDMVINGSMKHRLPNNVHITIPGQDNERLIMELDERGILAAAGSACSASNEEPSHVLKAIGLADKAAESSLRFSMGRSTTEAEIVKAAKMLASLV